MRKTALYLFCVGMVLLTGLGPGNKEVMAVTRKVGTPTGLTSPTVAPTETIAPTPTHIKENITEPTNKQANYRLESVLENQRLGKWNGINSVRKMIRMAVDRGVPANTMVLLLLLPLVATLVSVLHYLLGLSGYGIFMPTMIAMTFMATGIFGGLILFAMILVISVGGNFILKKLKLHFWPARAINLMLMALGTGALMVLSSYFRFIDLSSISIFPVLFMVLLSEEFVRTQLVKSKSEAKKLTVGTLILATSSAIFMNIRKVQEIVILNPELVVILTLIINLMVGNYSGIRLSEIARFRGAIRTKGLKIKS